MRELVTKSFAQQAMAFPDRVDAALAEIETIQDAKDLLDKADVMQRYSQRLKAGVEVERPIAIGVLKIKTKLGELLPRGKGGRGNKLACQPCEFSRDTILCQPASRHCDGGALNGCGWRVKSQIDSKLSG